MNIDAALVKKITLSLRQNDCNDKSFDRVYYNTNVYHVVMGAVDFFKKPLLLIKLVLLYIHICI